MELLGDVLKGLYISLSLCLLNNLKPCFKGVEGILGNHTRARSHRRPPVRFGLGAAWAGGCGLIAYFLEDFSFELFTYKLL